MAEYSARWGAGAESAGQLPPDQGVAGQGSAGEAGSSAASAGASGAPSNPEGPPGSAPLVPAAGGMSSQAGNTGSTSTAGSSSSTPATDPTAAEQCGDGVLDAAETSCYLVATLPATWQTARSACVSWGGELVKVETSAEDQLLGQLATQDLWLGGSDTVAENVFVWNDGSPILFGNWGPGQPDRFPGPDCIQKRSTEGRQWFDQPCDNSWLYICEKAIR